MLFFGFGISLAEMERDVGLAGRLIFSFALSLAFHEIWEVLEFLSDSIFHTDHQRWQRTAPSLTTSLIRLSNPGLG